MLSGWALIWAYLFIAIAGLSGFAYFAQQFLNSIGAGFTFPPVLLFLISGAVCWYVACRDIHISSALTLLLEALSISCIVTLAVIVLFKHGFSVDTPQLQLKGMSLHGLSLAVVISIFSLVGFESATTLGGEAKNPLKNVPKAVIWSLLLTGAFMVFMSYVEVFATRHSAASLGSMSIPLSTISDIYKVSWFKAPIALGAMVSFFSLSLSCLNAGSRIVYRMGRHFVFPAHAGRAHHKHQTPYIAITAFILIMFAIPSILQIWTNPLTTFDDAGTLAAFGFLTAYFLIAIAAPMYLKKLGELKTRNVVIAVIGFVCLLVPTIGSFYPAPPWPVWTYPYIFVGYMLVGAVWLYSRSRRRSGLLDEIEADLEAPSVEGDPPSPVVIDLTTPATPAVDQPAMA